MEMQMNYNGYTIEASLSKAKKFLIFKVLERPDFEYVTSIVTEEGVRIALEAIKDELNPKEEQVIKMLTKVGFTGEGIFERAIDVELNNIK